MSLTLCLPVSHPSPSWSSSSESNVCAVLESPVCPEIPHNSQCSLCCLPHFYPLGDWLWSLPPVQEEAVLNDNGCLSLLSTMCLEVVAEHGVEDVTIQPEPAPGRTSQTQE